MRELQTSGSRAGRLLSAVPGLLLAVSRSLLAAGGSLILLVFLAARPAECISASASPPSGTFNQVNFPQVIGTIIVTPPQASLSLVTYHWHDNSTGADTSEVTIYDNGRSNCPQTGGNGITPF